MEKPIELKAVEVFPGAVVQITSCDWYVWTGTCWRPMTTEEQLSYSR